MEWLISMISIAVSALISGLVGYLVKRSLDKYYKNKDAEDVKKQDAIEKLRRIELQQDRENLVKEINKGFAEEILPLKEKLDVIGEGTLSSLRNDILTCYYRCVEKGYRNDWDYKNIHDLYISYKELHGNSFISDIMRRFDELLSKEEYEKKKKASTKKKVLNESK